MLPFKTIIQISRSAETPVYLQIASKLIREIKKGIISPGTKLPGTRALAMQLEVHRKTVIAAYEELSAQGWITLHPYRGAFVSTMLPENTPKTLAPSREPIPYPIETGFSLRPNTILTKPRRFNQHPLEFNDGYPDVRLAPVEALSRAYRAVLGRSHRKAYLSYADVRGNEHLREVLAEYLRDTRGLHVGEENMVITRGSIMGLYLTINVIVGRNDIVVLGETSYFTATTIIRNTGAQVQRVRVDDAGIVVEDIAALCRTKKIRAVYVTPHHHHPTTVTLKAERRMQLLALAEQYRFAIIEDDYDFDYHYNTSPILPLASADTHGLVIYVGSLSKSIAPAFRVGFIAGPVQLIEEIAKLRRIIDLQGDSVLERAIAQLFTDGEIRRHQKKALKEYHRRRDIFCDMMRAQLGDAVQFTLPDGGMAAWVSFDKSLLLPSIAAQAAKHDLFLSDGLHYNPDDANLNATRMGFASLNAEELEEGITILRKVVRRI